MKSKLFGNTTKIILLTAFAVLPFIFAQRQNAESSNQQISKNAPTPTPKRKTKKKPVRNSGDLKIPDRISTTTRATPTPTPELVEPILVEADEPPPPPPPVKRAQTAASEKFKTETINKFGIGSLNLPENMSAEPVSEKKTKNGEVEWTTYRYEWKTPVSTKYGAPSLKAEISTNIYNADFTKVVPDLPAEFAKPEYLIQIDHSANLNSKKQYGDRIKEVELLNLNGADGSYTLFTNSEGNFVAVWQTYRQTEGKAQMLTVTIEGDPGEIPKAKQILKSFKFEAK